ncbi:thiamine-phosphate kinase [Acidithiobacillus sulfuriphilus]|uniref:Thiamine-monophosphate kinase n=2 Tax=Acidithiobacillus sulfuriphilus TaxID=1867749 RepID=A0A3M8RJ50_9PROT|nr:thiamine-phosphate kinase [Acidithiobacillus sulfuriphilus]RNF68326.1 thiamine-phosphate kinase [Acidithiobacillus sulfuriphilus]
MAGREFALIDKLQGMQRIGRGDVGLGMGDDAALLDPAGRKLAVSMDTLVAGRHFFADVDPADLGWKALAVNLSDLAAMGAEAAWCLLGLALPAGQRDWEAWLAAFMTGWQALAQLRQVVLVGGDTVATDGPLTLSVTALGLWSGDAVMTRAGAQAGDGIWVTGSLGDAAAALDAAFAERGMGGMMADWSPEERHFLEQRRLRPSPRLTFGRQAAALGVRAGIDCSDGFLADLGHILEASGVAAHVALDALPVSAAVRRMAGPDPQLWTRWPLSGGDDYELILGVAPALDEGLQARARALGLALTRVGEVVAPGRDLPAGSVQLSWQGSVIPLPAQGGHEHVF